MTQKNSSSSGLTGPFAHWHACRHSVVSVVAAVVVSGCDASVEYPGRLPLVCLGPLLILGAWWVKRRRKLLLERFAGQMGSKLAEQLSPSRRQLRLGLLVASVSLLALTLAGLRVGYEWRTNHRRGVDLMIVLDVSRSMMAPDADGSGKLPRLVRAKREIIDLLDVLQGDRVGLVAFAGEAFIQCPLTTDYSALEFLMRGLDDQSVPMQGTDIGKALRVALEGFESGPGQTQAILIITDGEDHVGETDDAVTRAEELGIRIFAVGVGQSTGAPIPGERRGFHTDRSGNIVTSRLVESSLKHWARKTGGTYVRSVSGDADLEAIYLNGIRRSVEQRKFEAKREKRWFDRFQWLLLLAMLALGLEPFIGNRKNTV